MNLASFRETLLLNEPPPSLSIYAQALWYDAKGAWDKAHDLIQDLSDKNAAWLHAYLHRKEGDIWNAEYWYNRAGRQRPSLSLDKEWDQLANTFL